MDLLEPDIRHLHTLASSHLPRAERACIACTVLAGLVRSGCSGTTALVGAWQRQLAPSATTLVARIHAAGTGCDCGFVTRLWQPAPAVLRWSPARRLFVVASHVPPCGGVRPRALVACDNWELVDRAALGRASPSRRHIRQYPPMELGEPEFACATWRPAC